MLNYIRAELYRALHRKNIYVLLGLLLLGELLLSLGSDAWPGPAFLDMVGMMAAMLPVGNYLTVLLAHFTLSDPYRHDTLKNEVSFGLSRHKIYLGKLLSALSVCLLVCCIAAGTYLAVNWLACAHTDPARDRMAWQVAGYVLADALPLWLGTLGLSLLVLMGIHSGTGGMILLLALLSILPMGFGLMTAITLPGFRTVGEWGLQVSLVGINNMALLFTGILDTTTIGKDWLLGMGWLAGSTALGLLLFRRKEL